MELLDVLDEKGQLTGQKEDNYTFARMGSVEYLKNKRKEMINL